MMNKKREIPVCVQPACRAAAQARRTGRKVCPLWLGVILCFFYFQSLASAAKLYVEGINAAPTKVVSSQRDAPFLKLRVYVDTGIATLNSIRVKPVGETGLLAVDTLDIATARIYKDSNNNGIVDSVDVLIVNGAYDGTYYNFASMNRSIDTFGETYLVTYDMASTASTNRTANVLLNSELDVSASVALSTLDYLGTPLYPIVSYASSTQVTVSPDAGCGGPPKCTAGQTKLTVTDASGLVDGDFVSIGTGPTKEVKKVLSVAGNVITFTANLTYDHGSPEEAYKLKPTTVGNKLYVFGSDYAARIRLTEYKTFVIKPAAGTTEVFVDQIRFCNPSTSPVTVTTIKLARVGNASDSDILNVKLYDDVNDNLATSGATFLSQGAFSGGFVTLPVGFVVAARSCSINDPDGDNALISDPPDTVDPVDGFPPYGQPPLMKNLVVKFEIPSTASTDVKAGIGIFDTTYVNAGSNTVVAFAAFINPEDEDDDCAWGEAMGFNQYDPNDTRVLVDTILDNSNGILPSAANTTVTLWEGIDCGANQQKSVRRNAASCYDPPINGNAERGKLEIQGSNITCFNVYNAAEAPLSWIVTWPNLYIRTDPFNINAERIEIGSILDIAPPEYAAAYSNFATTNAEQGKTKVPVLGLKLSSQSGQVSTSKISIDMGTGTATNADVSLVRAYEDLNQNGVVDSGESFLASSTFDGNSPALTTLTFVNGTGAATPIVVQSGTPRYLVFTYDFLSSATIGRTFGARIKAPSIIGTPPTVVDIRVSLASNDNVSLNNPTCAGSLCSAMTSTIVGNKVSVNGINLAPPKVKSPTNFVSFLQLQASVTSGSAIVNQIRVDFKNGADVANIGIYDDSNGDGTTLSTSGPDLLLGSSVGPFGAGSVTVDISAAPVSNRTVAATTGLKNFLVVLNISGAVDDRVRAFLLNNTYITLAAGGDTVDTLGFPVHSNTIGTTTLSANASAGDNAVILTDVSGLALPPPPFGPADELVIGTGGTQETRAILSVAVNTVTLTAVLGSAHTAGETVVKLTGTTITNYDSLVVSGQGNAPPHYLPPTSGLYELQMLMVKMRTYSGEVDFRKLRFKVVLRDTDGVTEIAPAACPSTYCTVLQDIIDMPNIKVKLDLNADAPPNVHDGVDCTGGFLPHDCDDPTVVTEPDPNNNEDTDLAVDTPFSYATGYITFNAVSVMVTPDITNGLKEAWAYIVFPIKSTATNYLGKRISAQVEYKTNPPTAFNDATQGIQIDVAAGDKIENYGTLSSGNMIIGGNELSVSGISLTTPTQKVQQSEKFGVLKLLFSANGSEPTRAVQVSKLQVLRTGTGSDSDVKLLYLYEDTNGNGALDGADLLMSTTTFDTANPGFATFSTWLRTITLLPGGASQTVLLAYTLSGNAASGVTLGADITNQTYVTVPSPDAVSLLSPPISSSTVTTQGNTVVVTGGDLAPAKITPATILGNTTVTTAAGVGAGTLALVDASGLSAGDYVRVGSGVTQETKMVTNIAVNTVSLDTTLVSSHSVSEAVVKLKSTTLVMEKLLFNMMSTFNYDSSPEMLPTAEVTALQVKALNSTNLNFMRLYRDNGSGTLDSSDRLLSSTGTFAADVATFGSFNTLLESTLDAYTVNNSTIVISDLFDSGRRFIAGDLIVVDPGTANEEKRTLVSVTKVTSGVDTGKTKLTLSAALTKAHTPGSAIVRTYIQPGQSKDFLVVYNVKITATGTTNVELTNGGFVTLNAPDSVALFPIPLQSSTSTYRDLVTVTPGYDSVTKLCTTTNNTAPTNVSLGQTGVPMLTLCMLANTNSATVNSIKIFESGSSITDSHVSLVSVYKDANSDGLFDAAVDTTKLATATFASQNATLTISPAQVVDTTTPLVLFAVYDITSSALATAYTLGARVSDESFIVLASPDEVASTNFPVSSTNPGVLNNDTLTVLTTDPDTETVAPQFAKPGDTNVPMQKISMSASSASITVNQLKVNKLGTILLSDVSAVKLFADNSSIVPPSIPGSYDSTDTLLLSTTFDGMGVATFAAPFNVSYTQNKILFVGVNIALTAPANDTASIGVKVLNGDVTVASPDKINAFSAFQSDLTTISNKDALTVSKSVGVTAPAQISRGTSANMLKLTLTAGSGSVTVTSVKVFENGSANGDTDVQLVSLYEDANNDNLSTSGELLSTGTFASQLITFNLSPGLVVTAGTPRSLIVNFTISPTASTAKTVLAQLVNSTYVTAASPDVVNFSVSPINSSSSTIIGNKLTVSGVDLVPVNCSPNIQQEASCVMAQLSLSASAGTITLSSVKINESGTSATDSHVERADLILDANGNAAYDIGDSVLSSAAFLSQNATFSGLSLSVTSGTPKKLLVQYNISSTATVGQTVAMTLTNNTFVTVVSPDEVDTANFPITSSASTIAAAAPDILTVAAASLAPPQLYQGQTAVAMEKLTLTAAAKSVFLTGITLTENGTSTVDADVSSVKIYKDNGDGNFSAASDTSIGSGVFAAQSVTIVINDGGTGSLRVNSSAAQVIFVVYDVAAAATLAQTLGVSIANETKLTVNAPDTVTAFPGITSTDSTIIAPPDILTIVGTDLTPSLSGTVQQSQQNAGMLKLALTAGTGTVTLSSLKIDEGGTSVLDTDIQLAKLYQDANANGTFEASSDTLLATGTFSTQSVTFLSLSLVVSAGTPKDLFVAYDISATAATGVNIDATVTAAGNITLVFPDTVAGTFPVKSGTVTIGGNTVTVAGTNLAPANVSMGQTGVAMEKLTFSVATGAATATQIKIDETGTSTTDSDISAAKLYLDEGNGTFDGTETLLLSTTLSSQSAIFGGLNINITAAAPQNVFIIYDISASSNNGVDFKVKLVDATYVIVTAPDTVAAFTAIESTAASLPDTIAPAAITNLAASPGANHGEIVLGWTAPGDDGNNAGTAATKYTIKRDTSPISEATWAAATTVANTLAPKIQGSAETFTVIGLTECTTYYFAIKAEDEILLPNKPTPNVASISNSPNMQAKDANPPAITHTARVAVAKNSASVNGTTPQDIVITATITDGCPVSSATLHYGPAGSVTQTQTMSSSGTTYTGTIPQILVTSDTNSIEYYIKAQDSSVSVSTYPASTDPTYIPNSPLKIGKFTAYMFAAPWSLRSISIMAADYGNVFYPDSIPATLAPTVIPTALVSQVASTDPCVSAGNCTAKETKSLAPNDSTDVAPPKGYSGRYTLACDNTNTLVLGMQHPSETSYTYVYSSITAQCLNPSLAPQFISSMDGKLLLNVPENAVKEEVVVTVIPLDDVKVSSMPAKQLAKLSYYIPRQVEKLLYVGTSYQVGPYRYTLEKEAQLTLSYDDSQLEGLPESKLGLYAWNDEKLQWEYIGGTINTEANTVTASTANFSTYRVILDNVPPEVKNVKPGDKDKELTRVPEISAELFDLGSGVDAASVSLYIDGKLVAVKVNEGRSRFVYTPEAPLAAGEHEMTIVVKDRVGNETRVEKQKLLIPGDIKIERVFNAPNPVRSWGEIAFQYEVDEVNAKFFDVGGYSVTIEVYTLTGKRIAVIEGTGLATKQKVGKYIRFRRKVDEGVELPPLPNGVYIFRLVARDFEGKVISKVNKMVIAR